MARKVDFHNYDDDDVMPIPIDDNDEELEEAFELIGDMPEPTEEKPSDLFGGGPITGKARWQMDAEGEDVNSGFDDFVDLSEDSGKKSKRFGKKGKKHGKAKYASDEVVEIQDNNMDEFVILEERGKTMWAVKTALKYAMMVALFLVGIFVTYILMSYRFVPEELMGAEVNVGSYSMISRDYQLPIDELKPGQVIMVSKTFDGSPFVVKYELYYFHSAQGEMFTVTSFENGLQDRIEQSDVSYVLGGTPRLYRAD